MLVFFVFHFYKASKDKTEYLLFTFYSDHFLVGRNRSKTFSD